MEFIPTAIPEVMVVQPRIFNDERGFFLESWQHKKFATNGLNLTFVQDNHSRSKQWTLRGLHYQIRQPQGKLVRVVTGEVFDVAVDMRRSSPTFGKWVGEVLSAVDQRMMWIPPGFAHGFLVLTETADFLYKCTDFYDPGSERTVLWCDPEIGIEWPLPATVAPSLSPKDAAAPVLAGADTYE